MATIKERLGSQAAEDLRVKVLMGTNPLRLNRTRFEAYLKAKSEVMLYAMETLGVETEPALVVIAEHLYELNDAWKDEAKRINLARRKERHDK